MTIVRIIDEGNEMVIIDRQTDRKTRRHQVIIARVIDVFTVSINIYHPTFLYPMDPSILSTHQSPYSSINYPIDLSHPAHLS
jgi:hypothetical protein